ncbi:MAG: class I mannose-6-phosphate isomerase [Bacteroidales bacterium]|nr:class I mannose-6-phosphate isomerase [Bacteroidales bacterium]MDD3522379.1 class I mannose-6-phosphate isomerase [Bacteroidales bacterium]MDD4030569.1 class I mannose-6-phosphate isomerase [Bacteroidales bacterium]MDD4435300.1 class I mannose-6-phosphate isomerase [Bacteroidales bacterium]
MNNNTNLYPLSFKPIFIDRVWGAETWVLSGLKRDVSVIENGFLKGNTINEALEVYLADLVGAGIYDACGDEFPLLIKYLNVNGFLSVQVHPDDKRAAAVHHAYGKTEMWYILDARPGARLYLGFNRDITPEEFYSHCENETLPQVMNCITPVNGKCYYIPAGLIHACGGGLTIAEVQQVSDITYRVYDWGREHNRQTAREMHLELALEAINFSKHIPDPATSGVLADSPYFKVRLLDLDQPMEIDGSALDKFVVYLEVGGSLGIETDGVYYRSENGCLLVPASVDYWKIIPGGKTKLLEITR